MRYLTPFIICLFAGALSQTVAAEPPQPPQPPAAATSPPSSNASTAPPATVTAAPAPTPPNGTVPAKAGVPPPASDTKAAIPKEVDAEKAARLRAMGYKPTLVHGRAMFCRREAQVGTRFDSQVCATAAEVDKATENGKDLTRSVQQNNMQPAAK